MKHMLVRSIAIAAAGLVLGLTAISDVEAGPRGGSSASAKPKAPGGSSARNYKKIEKGLSKTNLWNSTLSTISNNRRDVTKKMGDSLR